MNVKIHSKKEIYAIARQAAAEEFQAQFNHLDNLVKSLESRLYAIGTIKPGEPVADDFKLQNIELSVRAANVLYNLGIDTAGKLRNATEQEILKGRGLGGKTLTDLKNAVARFGIVIGEKSC